jgi:hypothetical protein
VTWLVMTLEVIAATMQHDNFPLLQLTIRTVMTVIDPFNPMIGVTRTRVVGFCHSSMKASGLISMTAHHSTSCF